MAFADFDMQAGNGADDSPEQYLADMQAEIDRQNHRYGLIFDVGLARRYAEDSAETYRELIELGFRFDRFLPRPVQHTVDRMVSVADTAMFTACFESALADAGVEVRYKTRAVRLLRDGDRVSGVVSDTCRRFGAANGVILAAGGYQANSDLRSRFQPEAKASTPYLGTEFCRGDGHIMGLAVGGDLINMTMIPPLVMVGSALVEDSIAVNQQGRRFHDEAGPYDDRVAALEAQPNQQAWYVFDNRVAKAKAQLVAEMPEPPISEATPADLAGAMGCDPNALAETLVRWNQTVQSVTDHDPDFGRVIFGKPRTGIVEPPLWAAPMVVGINFPAGGFRVNADMQVLDVFGDAISGLYAVGDCVGGVSPAIGLGGVKITAALTLGRIAGQTAARC
jgi:succinate dehydrogenase/fumarate reductase flavoprotein subunit